MADTPRFYLTTAIDFPNNRPHIGTAFEKLGADVQARYRRQEGYDVFFLMGNDENTVKVVKKAAASSSRRSTTTVTSTRGRTRGCTARGARPSRRRRRSPRPAASAPITRS